MRLSIFLILSVLVSAYSQEAVVEEETAAAVEDAVEADLLDLDALIDEADEITDAATCESKEAIVTETADETATATSTESAGGATEEATEYTPEEQAILKKLEEQTGPFVDLFGPQLYSLQMIDETQAQLVPQFTNDALKGKKVVGVYFSADWCGPCRKFTPELVSFYDKINQRRGHKDEFEIIWVSRCRDVQSYGQYFTHMKWLAIPPEEALGARGQMLSEKFKVKGIPSLTLLDDLGNVITYDARNKIPEDKAGIGFPWRNPLVQLYTTIFPRSLRSLVKGHIDTLKGKLVQRVKGLVGMKSKA